MIYDVGFLVFYFQLCVIVNWKPFNFRCR